MATHLDSPFLTMRKRRRRSSSMIVTLLLIIIIIVFIFYFQPSFLQSLKNRPRVAIDLLTAANTDRSCQTIDIAIVVGGAESSGRVPNLLKSLLEKCDLRVNLHFLVDEIAEEILRKLFETWQIPGVNAHFYNFSANLHRVSWIPNHHYSGSFGLMKLILPDLLPSDLRELLILDSDILLLGNIAELFTVFRLFNANQAVGLVNNLSEWYLDSDDGRKQPWPALERGYNTGVILMDLQKIRNFNWSKQWKEIANRNLQIIGSTHLADQDIFNAVIAKNPELLYKLPCTWNYQMGYQTLPDLCNASAGQIKLVHWNSPLRTDADGKHANFFRKHFDAISATDGNQLRRRNFRDCGINATVVELIVENSIENEFQEECFTFRQAGNQVFRTQLYVRPVVMQNAINDITLVTQLSMDRLVLLELLSRHWNGPISAAIYASDGELRQILHYFANSPHLSERRNLALHVVFKEGVNYLRNVALNATKTEFVFLLDVDFIPNSGLYEALRGRLPKNGRKIATVIPAFEFRGEIAKFPETKAELLENWNLGPVDIFRRDIWAKGHAATDYDKWRVANQPYKITYRPEYEPYIAIRKNETPIYDQRFSGFGWNKVSHIMTLNAMGFQFMAMPNGFVIHRYHTPSVDMRTFRNSLAYRKCQRQLKGEFIRDLIRRKNNINKTKNDSRR